MLVQLLCSNSAFVGVINDQPYCLLYPYGSVTFLLSCYSALIFNSATGLMLLQYLRELQALDGITGCGTGCQEF